MSNNEYVLATVECPECNGEGRLETMTWLTYDGEQSWKIEVCPHCLGERVSLEQVKCPICTDPILVSESAEEGDVIYHATCLREVREILSCP